MKNKFFTLILFATTVLAFTGCSNDDGPSEPIKIIIEGATVAPEIGGPNQPNQVYIDLSTNTTSTVKRDSWDLGFYSGSDFRVTLNASLQMAVAKLTATDINAVNSSTPEVVELQPSVAIGVPGSDGYVDTPDGNIGGTAIEEISTTDSNNHVYLVNLGKQIGTDVPALGGVDVADGPRGWKKIRILKSGNDYKLQYADLDATTFEEVTIPKNAEYNFTFFSFNTESIVDVEPMKTNWDLNITISNQILDFGGGMLGAYSYSDFVVNNNKSDAKVYMVNSAVDTSLSYDNFTLADVIDVNFTNDQRGIGSTWRNGGGPGSLPSLKDNVFYIINDTDGNLYKLKFLALTNEAGERGYPEFIYSLLQ